MTGETYTEVALHPDQVLRGRRVAVLNWKDLGHPDAGGAEVYAWQVARHLAERGAEVTFVTARAPGQTTSDTRDGVTIVRAGGRWGVYPRALAWLLRRRRRFDVVLDCQNGIPFFSPLVLPSAVPVVCVVHHVHDRQFPLYFGPVLGRFGAWLEGPVARRVYRRAVTLAVSPSTVRALRERLGWTAPIVVVPNGADATTPSTARRVDNRGAPRLICVGRVTRHKRVDLVVAALGRLRQRRPDVRLDVIGGGQDLELIRRQVAELGLGEHITVHGHVPVARRDALVESAWLHVSGSWGEGWGLVVLEAAAAGLPTVAFDVEGLRDAVRDAETGWLVKEGDDPTGELVEVLDRALTELADPAVAERTAKECRRWSEAFRWADTGERVCAVLRDLLAGRSVPWTAATACFEVRTDEPEALRIRLERVLPHTRHLAAEPGRLWLLVPGADPEAIRDLLIRAEVPADALTWRSAAPPEVLTGAPMWSP